MRRNTLLLWFPLLLDWFYATPGWMAKRPFSLLRKIGRPPMRLMRWPLLSINLAANLTEEGLGYLAWFSSSSAKISGSSSSGSPSLARSYLLSVYARICAKTRSKEFKPSGSQLLEDSDWLSEGAPAGPEGWASLCADVLALSSFILGIITWINWLCDKSIKKCQVSIHNIGYNTQKVRVP